MTNVLIIGGNRFLGKTIAEAFLQDGTYRVFELNHGTVPMRQERPGGIRAHSHKPFLGHRHRHHPERQ